jgi:hypothetical protein
MSATPLGAFNSFGSLRAIRAASLAGRIQDARGRDDAPARIRFASGNSRAQPPSAPPADDLGMRLGAAFVETLGHRAREFPDANRLRPTHPASVVADRAHPHRSRNDPRPRLPAVRPLAARCTRASSPTGRARAARPQSGVNTAMSRPGHQSGAPFGHSSAPPPRGKRRNSRSPPWRSRPDNPPSTSSTTRSDERKAHVPERHRSDRSQRGPHR